MALLADNKQAQRDLARYCNEQADRHLTALKSPTLDFDKTQVLRGRIAQLQDIIREVDNSEQHE